MEKLKEKTFVEGCENAPQEVNDNTYNPLHDNDEVLKTFIFS